MKQVIAFFLLSLSLSVPVSAESYGPTLENETLWRIASKLRSVDNVSVQQLIFALFHTNPTAFASNNINSLKKGQYLNIPTLNVIQRLSHIEATRKLHQHNKNWQNISKKIVSKSTQNNNKILTILQQKLRQEKLKIKKLRTQLTHLEKKVLVKITNADTILTLKTRIATLENNLQEKNIQIKRFKNMIAVAKDTIKRQQIDNEALFNKLKKVSPIAVKELSAGHTKDFKLQLSEFVDEQHARSLYENPTADNLKMKNTYPLPYILLIGLVVLLFIFTLIWRRFNQRKT